MTMSEPIAERFERPSVQWWPFRPRYLLRIHAYLTHSTGRCDPIALVEEADGDCFEANIVRPARHANDTWKVKAYGREGHPVYEVTTRQILEIQCGRFAAGYSC